LAHLIVDNRVGRDSALILDDRKHHLDALIEFVDTPRVFERGSVLTEFDIT
jgi:hypothetical protein